MRSAWKSLVRNFASSLRGVQGRADRLRGAGPFDAVGDFPGGLQLAPVAQHARQFGVGVAVDHVGGRQPAALVHPHVERRLAAEREAPFEGVEVVRRDPEVGQNAVDLPDAAQPQRPAQEAEVALDVVETGVVGAVGARVAVLVEGVETPFGPQCGEDAARVASAAEGQVGIGASRVDVEQPDGLFEQYGYVVFRSSHFSKVDLGVKLATFSRRMFIFADIIFPSRREPRRGPFPAASAGPRMPLSRRPGGPPCLRLRAAGCRYGAGEHRKQRPKCPKST